MNGDELRALVAECKDASPVRRWEIRGEMARAAPGLAAEVERLRAALAPFAGWWRSMGPGNLDTVAAPAYRRAAEALAGRAG